MKLVLKNCLTSIEDCEWTNKEIESSFFHQIKFTVFNRMRLKKSLLSYSATSFFTDIYRMVSFDRICLWLNTSKFYCNFDIIFEFIEWKHIPKGTFKIRVCFKQKLSGKMSYLIASLICNFLKMSYTVNGLELEANIFRIFISLCYLPLVQISKKFMS